MGRHRSVDGHSEAKRSALHASAAQPHRFSGTAWQQVFDVNRHKPEEVAEIVIALHEWRECAPLWTGRQSLYRLRISQECELLRCSCKLLSACQT